MPANSEINKANAQHSTGPKTPEGKKRASLNALRHGLTGQIVVMPTEDLEAYQLHLKSFAGELNPRGVIEANLVQILADTFWRLNRVAALETNLLTIPTVLAEGPITGAIRTAQALESHSKAFATLSLHSQRLSRQFERAVTQLRQLQQTRLTQEKQDLDNVLDIMEMYKSKGETYHPSADGFVFSEFEIAAARRARNREHLTAQARDHRRQTAAA